MAPRDPADKYPDYPGAGATTSGGDTAGSRSMIGVPKDYPGPAPNYADFFRPGGHIDTGGMIAPSGAYLHPPQYASGEELSRLTALSAEDLARLQGAMAQAGLIGPKTKFRAGVVDSTTRTAYKKLLTVANQNGTSDIDALKYLRNNPESVGEDAAEGRFGTVNAGGGSAAASPQYETHGKRVDKSVTNVTDLDAEQIANQAYQQALGSNAGPKQKRALRAALRAYAEAHPQISTTRSTYDPDTGRELSSSTSTRGGVDAAGLSQIAEDQAQAAPDYGEVQAATTYFNALASALGPAV